MKYLLLIAAFIAGLFAVYQLFVKGSNDSIPANNLSNRILLLGASVGSEWKLQEWAQRINNSVYVLEMIPEYKFDKREKLEEILMRPKRKFRITRTYLKGFFKPSPQKPNVLIIKECAAYFPGDLGNYKKIIEQMAARCRQAGITPMLATVVPVTAEHSAKKPGRLKGILEYNDWIKEYCAGNSIACLDLESFLRISDNNRELNPEFTSGDGLHLNKQAYDKLDVHLYQFLEQYMRSF